MGYNYLDQRKTVGGDFWLARVESVDRKSIFVDGKLTDYRNGTYLVVFPNLLDYFVGISEFPKGRIKYFTLKIRIVLERSSELIEMNRRAMSSLHFTGRLMKVPLPCKKETDFYRPIYKLKSQCMADCTMFPLEDILLYNETNTKKFGNMNSFRNPKTCNFSKSQYRTWYCYTNSGPVQSCEYGETTADITTSTDTSSSYIKALDRIGILRLPEFCYKYDYQLQHCGPYPYDYIDNYHQKTAFTTEYKPNFSQKSDTFFNHWFSDKYYEKAVQKINGSYEQYFNKTEKGNEDLNFGFDVSRKTFVVIGDSLGKQIYLILMRMMDAGNSCTEIVTDFWGQTNNNLCFDHDNAFNQKYSKCSSKNSSAYLIPHGVPIHHGGCAKQRMPSMIETFERLEKYGVYGENVYIILTPGAHFSFANPIFYHNRLLELKNVIKNFKQKFPATNILFKGLNWLPGDYVAANAVISSWNGMVLERVAEKLFGNEDFIEFLPLFNRTRFAWDQFSNTRVGIHPGKGTNANKAILKEIMKMIFRKFKKN